jgi:hypothetical protein
VTVRGTLIAESLSKGVSLEGVVLQVRRISRSDVGDVEAGQPLTWTFIEFEAADDSMANLIAALETSLEPDGGWYCDFRSATETVVVFANRAFRYPRGDPAGRARAEAHARSRGVPEAQLDWAER